MVFNKKGKYMMTNSNNHPIIISNNMDILQIKEREQPESSKLTLEQLV